MLAAIHIRQTRTPADDLTCAAVAWSDDGHPSTDLFTRPGATVAARYDAGLDAFARLYELSALHGAEALVHITDVVLRREIGSVAASFPAVAVIDVAYGPLGRLLDQASATIADYVRELRASFDPEKLADRRAQPELTVATDASKSSRRRGVGVACVSEDGIRQQRVYPRSRSILTGELLAIELAIERFPDRRLHILTDSLRAIAALRMSRSELLSRCDGEAVLAVDRIRRRIVDGTVRLSWVRGHSGHPLNEIADRLAVAARRNHEANVDADTRRAIADNIVAPLRGAAVAP